jgi:Ca2+-binding RTX toxin-like protein
LNTGVTATYTGADTGTASNGTATFTFSEFENFALTGQDDVFDASLATQAVSVSGAAGNDTLTGGSGNDTLVGGDGDDTLIGGTGDDSLNGGADADLFTFADGFGNDTITGGETATTGLDFDTIDLSAVTTGVTVTYTGPEAGTITDGTNTITFSEIEQIILTDQADVVDGRDGNEVIDGRDGDDSISGGNNGNDTLFGGDGNDTLFGVTGEDVLSGGAGNDSMDGGSSNDTLYGGTGDDWLAGGGEDDLVEGGEGDDFLSGWNGDDTLFGGDGDDTLNGGSGTDSIDGGADADTFLVRDNFGNNTIIGGDTFTTGANYDTIDLSALSNPVVVTFDGPGSGTITDFATGEVISFSGIEQLILTNNNDFVDATLDDGHTYIQTLDGDDFVQGSPGDDIYDDEIFGPNGQGNDTFIGGGGNDELWGGTDEDSLSGGAGSDTLNGQSGNDTLDGGGDADSLFGGIGDDSVTGGDGNDLIQEFSPGGTTVNDGDTVTGTNANESFVFAGDPGTNATIILDDGSGTANDGDPAFDTVHVTSTGENASLTLEGFGYGVDRIQVSEAWTGLSSTEIAAGHHQVVLTYENGNTQTFDVFHDNGSVFDPALVFFTYAGADTLEGGAGDDTIDGAFGDDSISGGTGSDSVLGGAGDDTIGLGNTHGADTILGGEDADGTDRDVLDLYDLGSGQGATVTYTGNEAGEVEFASAPGVISEFSEIEVMDGTNEADSIDAGVTTDGVEVYSNWGDDTVIGGSGADTIYAGLGADTLSGGNGADLLAGQEGDDTLDGGAGNDTLSGGGGQDSVVGGDGDDLIMGDDVQGGTFGLFAVGSSGQTGTTGILINGTFNFNASAPSTTVQVTDDEGAFEDLNSSGGSTQDTGAPQVLTNDITIDGITYPAGTAIHAVAQSDIVNLTTGETGNAWLIQIGPTLAGNIYLAYDIAVNDGDQITWTSSNDLAVQDPIYADTSGLDYSDLVQADGQPMPSNDTLSGGAGNDTIDGGAGDDSLNGGDGADSILGGDGADVVDAGTGDDTVEGGAGNDTVFAWTGDDSITGGEGDDVVFGQDGNDTILGGAGNDQLDGDDGGTLILSIGGSDRNGVPPEFEVRIDGVLVFTGTVTWAQDGAAPFDPAAPGAFQDVAIAVPAGTIGTVSVTFTNDFVPGDEFAPGEDRNLYVDSITLGDTTLESETDATITNGGAVSATHVLLWGTGSTATFDTSGIVVGGADSISGEAGNDTIIGDGGNDTLIGGADDDMIFAGADDDSVSGGTGNDQIFGEGGNDLIEADAGDDTVDGGDGNDTIFGFEGNDSVLGGAGDDVINTRTSPGMGVPDEGYGALGNPLFYPGDPDAFNDRDTVDGGTGNDSILTGDDNDIVFGGDGNDTVDAGFDDDLVSGGAGMDSLEGNEGNDTIDGGADDDIIYGDVSPDNPDFAIYAPYDLPNDGTDLAPGNNADSLTGGDGNDTIFGQDDNDTIEGGAGNDLLDGGIDDDLIDGGDGADTLIGGAGNDTLLGGNDTSADSLDGGDGDDELSAGDGDDTLSGGLGADSMFAGDGNDDLDGGAGDDTLDGWAGDDMIVGGTGDDLITGGDGNDTFTYAVGDGLDTITDFNFGNTGTLDDGDLTNNDFIDLSAFYDNIAELQDDFADDGILNQSNAGNTVWGQVVDYSDNTSFDTDGTPGNEGIVFLGQTPDGNSFTQENTGVICFTPGTLILTETGERPVEALKPGDRIVTRDNGVQTLQWLGKRKVSRDQMEANEKLRPVLIQPELIGADAPLLVSPQHGVLIRPEGQGEVLVRATHLARINGGKARIARGIRQVTYIHLMFDAHQIVFANGAPSESFYPGPMALGALAEPAQEELQMLFPALFSLPTASVYGETAREFARFKDLPRNEGDIRAA